MLFEEVGEFILSAEGKEGPTRSEVDHHGFLSVNEVLNIRQSTAALSVPKHEPIVRLSSHGAVLRAEKGGVPAGVLRSHDFASSPVSNIVAANACHAKDRDVLIISVCQVALYRFVNAICVADDYHQALAYHTVEAMLYLLV